MSINTAQYLLSLIHLDVVLGLSSTSYNIVSGEIVVLIAIKTTTRHRPQMYISKARLHEK